MAFTPCKYCSLICPFPIKQPISLLMTKVNQRLARAGISNRFSLLLVPAAASTCLYSPTSQIGCQKWRTIPGTSRYRGACNSLPFLLHESDERIELPHGGGVRVFSPMWASCPDLQLYSWRMNGKAENTLLMGQPLNWTCCFALFLKKHWFSLTHVLLTAAGDTYQIKKIKPQAVQFFFNVRISS